ncbi:PTS sugar transporter subunit IIB [Coprobacillaceae bacterium CR2/5/TPMF4]|nr:PTS sugar transporter subunit IIB [Coprobacillaceae bacterium CR2/5/TPMF4]
MAESAISHSWTDADCVLVAPQNAGEIEDIKGIVNNTIPVDVIDSDNFVKMNGQAVLDQAINLVNK